MLVLRAAAATSAAAFDSDDVADREILVNQTGAISPSALPSPSNCDQDDDEFESDYFTSASPSSSSASSVQGDSYYSPTMTGSETTQAVKSEEQENTGSSSAATAATPMMGAKRRKPQKTNKVTKQQVQEANMEEEDESPRSSEEPMSVACHSPAAADHHVRSNGGSGVEETPVGEPIIPPGPIPKPIISSTTVVTSDSNSVYRCPLCEEDLMSQKDFTTHIRGHNEVKPHPDPNDPTGQAKVYYCCLCGKMLSSFSSLDRHMLVHSGERPFSCELCGQTFTTNGNMHRHKRTHSAKELQEYGEAMGVSLIPTGRRGGRKRKNAAKEQQKSTSNDATPKTTAASTDEKQEETPEPKVEDQKEVQVLPRCSKCQEALPTEAHLDAHLESAHAGEEFKCDQCSFSFVGYGLLKVHKLFHTALQQPPAPPVLPQQPPPAVVPVSFASLAAAAANPSPFSSHSFPKLERAIRAEAESFPASSNAPLTIATSNPSPSPLSISTFGSPLSAFPGRKRTPSAASGGRRRSQQPSEQHEIIDITCVSPVATAAAASSAEATSASEVGNKEPSALSSTVSTNASLNHHDVDNNHKDLADVQSILSITKQSNGSTPLDDDREESQDGQDEEDEINSSHDDHDPVLKDMKLKGEFPCRLCPAVYPNLRALKGHNKEHLNKAPYCCNVGSCTYSSNDKSTLTRHMRIHTGEKPFECKLCNYGFTTKANCERHLKNKHGKTNREQIRENLIIHESEETVGAHSDGPPVPAVLQKLQMEAQREAGNFRCKVCKQLFLTSEKVIAHAIKDHPAYSSDVDHIFEELKGRCAGLPGKKTAASIGDLSAPSMVPRVTNYPPMSQLKPLQQQQEKQAAAEESSSAAEEDAPLDLSRPAAKQPAENSTPVAVGSQPVLPQVALPLLQPTLDPAVREELLKNNAAAAVTMGLLPAAPFMFPQGTPSTTIRPVGPQPATQNPAAAAASVQAIAAALQLNPAAAAAFMPAAAAALNLLPQAAAVELPGEVKQRLQLQQQQQLAAALAGAAPAGNPLVAAGAGVPAPLQPPANPLVSLPAHIQAPPRHPIVMTPQLAAAAPSHPIGPTELAAFINSQQEILRKQQQQGEKSSMVAAAETLQSLSQAAVVVSPTPASPLSTAAASNGVAAASEKTQESIEADAAEREKAANGGHNSDSDSNYKMVIQNGVLMKKQKQRRYRTERPYGCPHCNARFTLRSNMERHIKQQHPQHYSSRPRGSRRNHTATVPVLAPQFRDGKKDEGNEKENGVDQQKQQQPEVIHLDEQNSGPADEEEGKKREEENGQDLASVSCLLHSASASSHSIQRLFVKDNDEDDGTVEKNGEEDEDEEDGHEEGETEEEEEEDAGEEAGSTTSGERKKSAYSAAPHKIPCPYCSRKFPWTSSLKRHILTHTGDKPYKCNYCPLLFTTKSNCDRHMVRKHGAAPNSSGGDTILEDRRPLDKPLKCPMCPASNFMTEHKLRKHQWRVHLNIEYPRDGEDDSSEDEEDGAATRAESAASTNNGFVSGSDDQSFKCHLCEESFPERSEAIAHLQISHADDYDTLVSRGAFSSEVEKGKEEEEEEDERAEEEEDERRRRVFCLFCLGRFWSAEELKRHVRKHTGERPFSCGICHRRFMLKRSMLRHKKKHDSGVSSDGSESETELQISTRPPTGAEGEEEEENGNKEDNHDKEAGGSETTVTPTAPSPTAAAGNKGRKRASLMDTIAKLSSAKKKKVA